MLEFQWPWMSLVLPLPWLFRLLLSPVAGQQQAALKVPHIEDYQVSQATVMAVSKSSGLLTWLAILAWLSLVAAVVRPQWLGEPIELPVSGRNIMMAVDLSGSMEVQDFRLNGRQVNRLIATKSIAGEFIERRVGDRIGLILFGKHAYMQTPLTFDRETVRVLLYEAVIGLAGKETAIGDAIGLAVKRLRDSQNIDEASEYILILLTDGANTAGEIKPLKAAELAAELGLKIYTIGIGADEMTVSSFFGSRKVNPSMDLDEETLTGIATATGGRYFRARDIGELEQIYEMIDELEPVEQELINFRPKRSLYYWPLALSFIIAFVLTMMSIIRGR
ncbi:MAG: VWA domain-containing protein [Thiohalomonadales bacterium]